MSSFETPQQTDRGFGLSGRDAQVIGGASILMVINILVMAAIATTPLQEINAYLFSIPILGVLVYGAAIMGGEIVAERGVTGRSDGLLCVVL